MNRQDEFAKAPPSRVIEMALEDLEAVEKQTDKYTVSMEFWHEPLEEVNRCGVCLAGAVIADTFEMNAELDVLPSDFPFAVQVRLFALDNFRRGYVEQGLLDMGIWIGPDQFWPRETVTPYGVNTTCFKRDMRALAAKLKERGL